MRPGPTTILIVEDDRQISALVSDYLRSNGFEAIAAASGAEMEARLAGSAVDLVILDLMLPQASGLDLCRSIRARSSLPIIMLTAKGEDTDRIAGLEAGADDYLAKPFNPRELLARINAVLRRSHAGRRDGAPGRGLAFAGWALDVLTRELTNPQGVVIDLSTGEYDLLLAFLEAPQRVLSREQLLDQARNRAMETFDRSIDVQVSRLRRKIEGDGEKIRTVRGAGYLFMPDVVRR